MALTDKQIKALKARDKKYTVTDQDGLIMEVRPNGGKYWTYRYRLDGKRMDMSLGAYPSVGLKQARNLRDDARKLVDQGIDPKAARTAARESKRNIATNTFEALAREWYELKYKEWSESHQQRTIRNLEHDLFPTIGRIPTSDIEPMNILEALKKAEKRGITPATLQKIKQTAGQVFRYGISTGQCKQNPTRDLNGAISSHQTKHHAALTEPRDVGRLIAAMDNYQGTPTVIAALKLSALWFCRPGELRHLKWAEINHEEQRIELGKGKAHEAHIIPLSRQAVAILEELYSLNSSSEYVFPSARSRSRPMSENAVRVALRNLGYDNSAMSAHGFRAMARTLLDEVLGFRQEWIEHQLAHNVRDPLGRAYNRTKHLKQRREMMQRWADYLDQLKQQALSGNVITAPFGRKAL